MSSEAGDATKANDGTGDINGFTANVSSIISLPDTDGRITYAILVAGLVLCTLAMADMCWGL